MFIRPRPRETSFVLFETYRLTVVTFPYNEFLSLNSLVISSDQVIWTYIFSLNVITFAFFYVGIKKLFGFFREKCVRRSVEASGRFGKLPRGLLSRAVFPVRARLLCKYNILCVRSVSWLLSHRLRTRCLCTSAHISYIFRLFVVARQLIFSLRFLSLPLVVLSLKRLLISSVNKEMSASEFWHAETVRVDKCLLKWSLDRWIDSEI